jgi:hypothetical protein
MYHHNVSIIDKTTVGNTYVYVCQDIFYNSITIYADKSIFGRMFNRAPSIGDHGQFETDSNNNAVSFTHVDALNS